MKFIVLASLALLCVIASAELRGRILATQSCLDKRLADVKAQVTPLRGVNLGAWFLPEYWMINSLWDDNNCSSTYAGEWQLEQCLGSKAQAVMEKHWSTWITEADFAKMATMGVNVVRIPVGWWQIYDQFGGMANASLNYYISPSNYVNGSLKYLDQAFVWGAKYGVGILVDLHAAPGSQNGNDHSSPSVTGGIYWDKYASNQGQTVDSIGLFADRYNTSKALLGFCLLNEPAVDVPTLQNYYKVAYTRIRSVSSSSMIIINPLISPFQSGSEDVWTSFMNTSNYTNVFMSLHFYHCFGGVTDPTNYTSVVAFASSRTDQIKYYNSVNNKKMIVDEWSNCGVPDSYGEQLSQTQLSAFSLAHGWTFWSWKLPGNNAWEFQSSYNLGWINSTNMATAC